MDNYVDLKQEEYEEFQGRIKVQRRDFNLLSHGDMVAVGEDVAKSIPSDWKVVVTAGPWRDYGIQYELLYKQRVVLVDCYSANPQLYYLPQLIEEVITKIIDYKEEY